MKTLLKIVAALVIILVALLFILPIVYKSEIISLTKNEINKNVNATIDFKDIDLSLIKSFPDFSISIYELNIVGNGEFKNDTLFSVKTISLAVDIFSVISSDNYEIKKISLYDPVTNIKVLENGHANYDIGLPDENTNNSQSSTKESSAFQLAIKKFSISNGSLTYINNELNTEVYLSGIYHTLSGKLGADNTILYTNTKISNANINYEGIPYMSDVALAYKANIDADIKNEIYTLGKNELILNNLLINFDGSVSFIDDDLNLILTFNSQGNKFKDILSLLPAIYSNDFEDISAEGTFSVNGFVKGAYNEDRIPSFNISTVVADGMIQYPGLPKSVSEINIVSNISNKGGLADNTIIDVSKFYMLLGDDQFNANFKISTPVSDPEIKAKITGKIDLDNIDEYYPLDDEEKLQGEIILDMLLEGRLSSIENEKYEDFLAMGSLVVKDIYYNSNSLKNQVHIPNAQLNFSPHYLDLVNFKAKTGNSDLQITGKIENYLGYYFNTAPLSGNLISNSNYLNIDELFVKSIEENNLHETTEPVEDSKKGSNSTSVIEIPDNINITVTSRFKKLIYDSLEMYNVNGKLILANRTLKLKNLTMNAVEGRMTINGNYSTADVSRPEVDFSLKMDNLSIPDAYNKFAIFRTYLPLAKKSTGLFSADFRVNTILDENMMPDYSTMNGGGILSTSKITINDLNSLTQIAEALNLINFKQLELNKLLFRFQFVNGKLNVKPTKFNYRNIYGEIEGWTGFDQSIGYDLNLKVPRSEFGSEANKVLDDLLAKANSYGANFSLPDVIPVNITIGGTLSKPKIQTKLDNIDAGSIVEKEIEEQKEKLGKEAAAKAQKIIDDADKQAKYLIKEAEKQATYIRENADDAMKELNKETDKQAKALIAEGKKNGFIAEMAAKEAAKQMKNEVTNQGANIIKEADKNADAIIQEAKRTAKKLKQEAEKEAKKILRN